MKQLALLLLAGLALCAPARADDPAMGAAANAFYSAYASLPRGGGVPDATARVRYAPLLSPRLNQMIAAAAAAETRFQAKNKNSPPLVEGDLFSSLFEGATGYKVGLCTGDAKAGSCTVSLTYADPKQRPETWNDMVLLVNTPAGWKVDDIAYKAGFQFGNSGNLSDTLKFVVKDAQ